jgi:subfamily B ATP-binding cassette protein HlyB/CyaB
MNNQGSTQDAAIASLHTVCMFHKINFNPEDVRHKYADETGAFNDVAIVRAAISLGLKAGIRNTSADRIDNISCPAIVYSSDGVPCVLLKVQGDSVIYFDPRASGASKIDRNLFKERFSRKIVMFSSRESIVGDLAKFDISWFVPAVIKYRKLLGHVLIASFVLQLFALATPLFFQVIMDKVLVHRSIMTLDILAIGILAVTVFEGVLGGLRTYIFSHTTNRIDVELGQRLYAKLVTLPVAYFKARRVGDSVARIRELESIRSFITGNAVTLVIDLLFSVVFFALMLYYSPALTGIVAGSIMCYIGLSAMFTPILKHRLNEKFARGADNQAFLVESITNIDTVKAMAIESTMHRKWGNQLAAYVTASFRANNIANLASNSIGFVSKIVTLLIMWLGARMVMEGTLSIGQLIAFNMLAGRVSQPVMRLSQLWTDWQQVGIAVERLGDIMNTPSEPAKIMGANLPAIKGRIDLRNVSFKYPDTKASILNELNLTINQGEVIGVVGRSGSGKSTLTKLIQRMYLPEQGRILVDGMDLSVIDPSWLRNQIGVVLQETQLFNRSIRENISVGRPNAPMEQIVAVAHMAGCHEFISELPDGYETVVGEQGSTLSGGQRQRIAIARALLSNPRILIFDEATSALDYESESIIQQNMKDICAGRTVIIIAHRLSAVRRANRIIVMEKGNIVESGSHEELMGHQMGAYRRLYQLQAA